MKRWVEKEGNGRRSSFGVFAYLFLGRQDIACVTPLFDSVGGFVAAFVQPSCGDKMLLRKWVRGVGVRALTRPGFP